jgi:hypothetical protein
MRDQRRTPAAMAMSKAALRSIGSKAPDSSSPLV